MTADTRKVLLERDGDVAVLTLSDPASLNALAERMLGQLLDAIHQLRLEQEKPRCLLITGAGRGFCSGSDIGAMLKADGRAARARLQRRHAAIQAVYRLEKPVIAAVQGPAAGIGFSLAMACDMIVATQSAYFQLAFRNVGLVPDGGSVFFLTQRLGVSRAKDLVMTGRRLEAAEASDWGLVNRLVPDGELEAATLAFASELAAAPTYVIALSKKMFTAASSPSLETVLEIESYAAAVARASKDHQEGVAAFKEKRKARFTGE